MLRPTGRFWSTDTQHMARLPYYEDELVVRKSRLRGWLDSPEPQAGSARQRQALGLTATGPVSLATGYWLLATASRYTSIVAAAHACTVNWCARAGPSARRRAAMS